MSRILVVDDSSTMRKIIARNLSLSGLPIDDVEFAENGQVALDLLRETPAQAVLTDLNMPVLDGVGFVRELRSRGDATPIWVLSTSESADRVDEAIAAGANGFIPKPFTPEKLAEELAALLSAAPS